ncbi:MAG: hypothetical protein MJK04_30580, partial [Psychrosphaera sp.]|nr:hypothetical protein [Psychrosphaera sp.]
MKIIKSSCRRTSHYTVARCLFALYLAIFQYSAYAHSLTDSGPLTNSGPLIKKIESLSGQSLKDITDFFQDQSGFIWMSSGHGLLRFDGYSVKRFSHVPADPNSLPHDTIAAMVGDDNGFLWLITRGGGLSRFELKTERFVNFAYIADDKTSLDSNKLLSISLGENNRLWIGSEQGINLFDRVSLKNKRLNSGAQLADTDTVEHIYAIYEDKQQQLWFVIQGTGLYLHDANGKNIAHFKSQQNNAQTLDTNVVTRIYQTP